MKKIIIGLLFLISVLSTLFAQAQSTNQNSGGKLTPEQAAYDVKFYDINLKIDTTDHAIGGYVIVRAEIVNPIDKLVLNLDSVLNVDMVELINDKGGSSDLPFVHENDTLTVKFSKVYAKGTTVNVKISYAGIPRVAKLPPWDDGFVWSHTKSGASWITVTSEGSGADIWWPCKDHPSDEPDSVALHFTYPQSLVCASNGRLRGVTNNNDGTATAYWFVSTPINNYNVCFYLAPYKTIEYSYKSISGDTIPFIIYVLPESYEKAKAHTPQFLDLMKFMEEYCGPYPFRIDKCGVAEAPHLGMEHQTIIAYGYGWRNHKDYAFDWLFAHEFSHEWWGNLVTCDDWNGYWIHESFGTYMQPLYLEWRFGKDQYFSYMQSIKMFQNKIPVAPRKSMTTNEIYSNDIYYKGAWILHTLRHYLGDEVFFKALRRLAYPDPAMEKIKTGAQCRLTNTDEVMHLIEKVSGKKLDWYFEVYLRNAELPVLNAEIKDNKLLLTWQTKDNLPFPLPVDVKLGGDIVKVDMNNNHGEVDIPAGVTPVVDPDSWLTIDRVHFPETK